MKQLIFYGCLLVIVANFIPLRGESITVIGDVEISINDTDWKCDKIFCPPETYTCRVIKQKLELNATQVQRVDTCYDVNNTVLAEAINYDPIDATENISLNLTAYRTGSISSSSNIYSGSLYSGNNYISTNDGPIDQEELDNAMAIADRVNAEVEENLRKVNEEIERANEKLERDLEELYSSWKKIVVY